MAKLSRKTIETLSVNAVRDSIMMTDHLDQFIPDNDKEPFWDGAVYIYESNDHTKENFRGRMPVQVKGTENEDFSKDEISFPISTTDLRGYLADGGAIYFVVYIGAKGLTRKIYYIELTPIRIRIILDEAKKQGKKSVKLKAFPNDNNKKSTIFLNCLQNCKKQASFAEADLLSIEALQEQGLLENITIPLTGVGIGNDLQAALVSNDVYIYANIKGSAIPQPLKILPKDMQTYEEVNALVSIDGRFFYNKVQIIQNRENIKYVFGSSLTLIINQESSGVNITYKNSDDVRTISTDLEFLLTYIEKGYFEINGQKCLCECENTDASKFNIEEQKSILAFTQKATAVLDAMRCEKKLFIDSLGNEDCRNLYRLYDALVENKPVKGLKEDLPYICAMKVGNLNFVIVLRHIGGEQGAYNLDNFFGAKLVTTYQGRNGERLPMSQYAILKSEDFLRADNIQCELFLPSFKDVERHEETFDRANWFLLDLLSAYDKSHNQNILSAAYDFAEWILTDSGDSIPLNIKTLNMLQVVKRMRAFTDEETNTLYQIVADRDASNSTLVGAHLLLDQQPLAEIYFSKMEEEEQEEFVRYPIYRFWQEKQSSKKTEVGIR